MAAIILKQSFPGYIDRYGVGADALDKTIDALRERYNQVALQGAQFFRTATPKGGVYHESTFGTSLPLPVLNNDSDNLPFVGPVKGFKKSFSISTYRLATQVERAMTEDELVPVARRMAGGLMNAGRLLLEYQFADIFNNLTATGAAYLGADGVAVAASTHPYEKAQVGTWSNIESSGALTAANFSTARTNLRKRTNDLGYHLIVTPKMLIVPPDKETAAKTLMASEQVPGGALNDKWVWSESVQVVVYDYLTSTTSWMLWGDIPQEYNSFLYIPEVQPNLAPTEGADRSTDIIWGERLRMRHAIGSMGGDRNIQYNAGA
jgi:hypothetical protein